MGKKSDTPEYPVELMQRQLDASEAAGNRYLDLSTQQQDWTQNMWDEQMFPMLQETTGAQTEVMKDQLANARKDRARYEEKYQPLEDNLIDEFQNYDTDKRRNLESGRAMAQVQQSYDSQRGNAEQRLASYGVDPSQLRAGAIDADARVKVAAQQAMAGNTARNRVEDTGRALRAEAINIGRGMPSQVAQSYGQTVSAGNSAQGNMNSTMGQGGNMMGTGASWGGMQGQAQGQTMSGANNMYSGQLAGYNAEPDTLGALGGIAGNAFGAWAGSGFAEGGGAVGSKYAESGGAVGLQGSDLSSTPGPNDAIPVTLAPNEYIIPADVAIVMGTEKLDSMVEKTRQKAGERGGANTNTPAGEMPNEEAPIKGQTLAAEGGGAVGAVAPMPIEMMMPSNPGWGYNMQNDPFAEYNGAKAMQREAEDPMAMDLQASIAGGAKMRDAMLERQYKQYGNSPEQNAVARGDTLKRAASDPKPPKSLAAEGGGAVGMPGKLMTPAEEEAIRLRAEAEERARQQYADANPQQGGGAPPIGAISQFTGGGAGASGAGGAAGGGGAGGATGGGGGSMLASAGPWAALAAVIGVNEKQARDKGRRDEEPWKHARQAFTGEGMANDMGALGDKVGGFGGKTIEQMGILGSPIDATEQLGHTIEKGFKNTFTPWKIFD